jgi:hypothetical protein
MGSRPGYVRGFFIDRLKRNFHSALRRGRGGTCICRLYQAYSAMDDSLLFVCGLSLRRSDHIDRSKIGFGDRRGFLRQYHRPPAITGDRGTRALCGRDRQRACAVLCDRDSFVWLLCKAGEPKSAGLGKVVVHHRCHFHFYGRNLFLPASGLSGPASAADAL